MGKSSSFGKYVLSSQPFLINTLAASMFILRNTKKFLSSFMVVNRQNTKGILLLFIKKFKDHSGGGESFDPRGEEEGTHSLHMHM